MSKDSTTGRDSLGKAVRRNLSFRRVGQLFAMAKEAFKAGGFEDVRRAMAFRWQLATHGEVWRFRADIPLKRELKEQRKVQPEKAPLFSVIVPLYNTPPRYLRQMIRSVRRQTYRNWELVMVDASDKDHGNVADICKKIAKKDDRVRYAKLINNDGIAGNTNVAFGESRGAWLCLLDHDDILAPNALYDVVAAAAKTGADFVYSDEIVLSADLKRLGEYHFKPDFGPDTLRGCNYITHLCAFTADLLYAAGGGEDPLYDGAQDYDLILRLSEKAKRVCHVPKVLYYWRRHGGSTASGIEQKPYALKAGADAIQAQLDRLDIPGTVEPLLPEHAGAYRVRYEVWGKPQVSVIIPNKDHVDDLKRCINSLCEKAGSVPFEILVVENNSTDAATESFYLDAEEDYENLRVVRYSGEFNFAAICNLGAKWAKGDQLLLLNNDVELISEGFLDELVGYSQRLDVGAVGAMLYYSDATVQHAGLFVGIGGTAGVNHKGHDRGDGGDLFRLCTTQNMSAVTGAALMVKKTLWEELGGMDEERFGVAFNDVDFCLRLREKGYWNVFTPFAEAWHYESKSRGYDTEGARLERFEREKAAFQQRHAAILREGDPFYNPHFTLEHENYGYK